MAYLREDSRNTFDGLKSQTCAAVGYPSNHQPPYEKESGPKGPSSGSRACDPVSILDDDEPNAAEVSHVDLEKDNKVFNEGNYTTPIKQAVAGAYHLGFQSLAGNHTPYGKVRGPDPPRHTESVARPLFRAFTQGDLLAPSAQPLPESQAVGFKAWCRSHHPHHTGKAASAMQQEEFRHTPSIMLSNKERTKKPARADCDAPQFAMSVLKSNRKRTIAELGYNELLSPTQVESPSEKQARMANRRRQLQDRCNFQPQDTNAGDTQSAPNLDHVHGPESGRMTRETVNLAVSPIVNEALDNRETSARMNDEDSGPTIACEPSPVRKDQRHHIPTQDHDDHVETHRISPTQTTTQDHDALEHGDSNNTACLNGSISRKPYHRKPRKPRKPRIGGPTDACGVFSLEKKLPVKKPSHGDFHCPRCDSQFTKPKGVNYHFEKCITMYGNPKSLRWNDHPSLGGVINKSEHMITVSARAPNIPEHSASFMHDIESVGRPATTISPVAPLPASNIQATGLSSLPETRFVTKEPTLGSDKESELDHQTLIIERRATGGKGLSAETLKNFQETKNWNCDIDPNGSTDGRQHEETEVPNIAYRYSVSKREWLETEEDAMESSMGPYYTLNEANTVAKAEVQRPQIDGLEGIESKGWSYFYREDEHGMQTHMTTVLGINIEAVVHRGLAPANEQVSIPVSAFLVAQRIYIVQELQWLPADDNTMSATPFHCQSLTHGAFTLLRSANKRAAAEYVESLTGNWSDSEYGMLKKAEMKSEVDKKVRVLNEEDDCFCEAIRLENEGFAKVWVELVVVEGPRN